MNKLLVRTLDFLNGFIAFFIIVPLTLAGIPVGGILGSIVGAFAGTVIAALVCGVVAYLSLIERHLSTIAAASSEGADNLRFLAKSANLQNAVAEMQIAEQEERERRRLAA
jgi:signal transduction histidine kinase